MFCLGTSIGPLLGSVTCGRVTCGRTLFDRTGIPRGDSGRLTHCADKSGDGARKGEMDLMDTTVELVLDSGGRMSSCKSVAGLAVLAVECNRRGIGGSPYDLQFSISAEPMPASTLAA